LPKGSIDACIVEQEVDFLLWSSEDGSHLLAEAAIESCDPVSHSMVWIVAPLDLRDSREPRSRDRDRVAARMVMEESVLSWRTNSRPSHDLLL